MGQTERLLRGRAGLSVRRAWEQASASWAEGERDALAGRERRRRRTGLGRARGKKTSGPKEEGCVGWVWNQAGLGSFGFGLALGFGLLFYFPFSFLVLNLIQTKFEF